MAYSAVIGTECMVNMANIIDTVDGMVLEGSERKVVVDGGIVRLWHRLSREETRMSVVEWKGEVTEHLRDVGDSQGVI